MTHPERRETIEWPIQNDGNRLQNYTVSKHGRLQYKASVPSNVKSQYAVNPETCHQRAVSRNVYEVEYEHYETKSFLKS
jgi:hypothetical protein